MGHAAPSVSNPKFQAIKRSFLMQVWHRRPTYLTFERSQAELAEIDVDIAFRINRFLA